MIGRISTARASFQKALLLMGLSSYHRASLLCSLHDELLTLNHDLQCRSHLG